MREVAEVYSAYCHQIEDNFEDFVRNTQETLAEASTKTIETVRDADSTTDELITAVRETCEVNTPRRAVVEIYAWASVTAAASMIGTFMGYTILAPLLSYFTGTFSAATLGFLIIPLSAHFLFRSYDDDPRYADRESDSNLRYLSLGLCMLQGAFNGHVIHNIYITGQPPLFLTPTAIAYSFAYMPEGAGKNRVAQLSFSISSALAANIFIGAITGSLTAPYYFLSIGYCAVAGFMMQVIFRKVHRQTSLHSFQHAVTSLLITVKGLFFLLFGSYV
ncbi:hypothetical protein Y032_0002g769 [Ancylostoma ceylanicum]|nr:hypothetical protein Y032_0002g769 [Ancylostoma ceylanicum]